MDADQPSKHSPRNPSRALLRNRLGHTPKREFAPARPARCRACGLYRICLPVEGIPLCPDCRGVPPC